MNLLCKAYIAITGAIQGTSRESLYQELGLESLRDRCRFRKFTFFKKLCKIFLPNVFHYKYLRSNCALNYQTRTANENNLKEFSYRTESFRYSFFPFPVREWNNLVIPIRKAKSIKQFKSMLMRLFILKQGSLFLIHDHISVKLLARLRLKLSDLHEHKFRHKFKYCVSPMFKCGTEIEITKHFFPMLQITCQWKNKTFMTNFVC